MTGKKHVFDVRKIKDLKDMVNQSAEIFGDSNAFIIKKGDDYSGKSYNEFKAEINCLGTALLSLGLKDQYIAVIGENRYEWCVTYLSAVNGTGIIVPLDKELPASEIENLLNRSKVTALVFSAKLEEKIKEIHKNVPSLKYLINMDIENDDEISLSFKVLINKGRQLLESGDTSFTNADIDSEALSILLFTSGTTDLAKGVMLSHKNICSNIMAVRSVIHIDNNDSVLSILPLHHTYECTCGFLTMVYSGSCIAFNEGLKYIGKNLQETKPSILLSVPLILENMYKKIWSSASKKPGLERKLKIALFISNILYNVFKIDIRKKLFKPIHENVGGRIRLAINGAAAIDPDVSKGFRAMGINVLQGYGLTECSPIVTCNVEYNFKHSSIGLPLPGIEVRLEDLNEDGIGELVTKGNNVMLGYFGNELATEKVLNNGWLKTGDLGYKDDDGFYYITGRKKNVIVTKNGKNIFPEEVEAYINKSPYIFESLVWGKKDEQTGETYVYAQIVPDLEYAGQKLEKDKITDEEIHEIINSQIKNINKKMPLYKRVRKFIVRQTEFEKTTTRKIKRYVEKEKL